MKIFVTFQIFFIIVYIAIFQEGASGQSFYPTYGGAPIVYENSDDDDIGLLLTVLLLAARNRNGNCNCCNCCNCGNVAKNVPIPYPIPFPTNNPIINNRQPIYTSQDDDDDDEDDEDDVEYKDQSSTGKVKSTEKYDKNITLKYVPVPVDSPEDDDY